MLLFRLVGGVFLLIAEFLSVSLCLSTCCNDGFEYALDVNECVKQQDIDDQTADFTLKTIQYLEDDKKMTGGGNSTGNLPECKSYNVEKIPQHRKVLNEQSCLAKVGDEYYTVGCAEWSSTSRKLPTLELGYQKKCCPVDQLFNEDLNSCSDENAYQLLQDTLDEALDGPVLFDSTPLVCEPDQIFVEYIIEDIADLQIDRVGNLLIKTESLKPNDYCMDLWSSTEDTNNSELIINTKFLVRTCQDKSICKHITCLPRCCNANSKYIINEFKCEPASNSLNNIGFIEINKNNIAKIIETPVHGFFHNEKCTKIGFSSSNPTVNMAGQYIDDEGQFIELDDYCIENIQHLGVETIETTTFTCYKATTAEIISVILDIIGSIFIFMTIFVYFWIPKLRNLPGKFLLCELTSMLATNVFQMLTDHYFGYLTCNPLHFIFAFFLLSMGTWMNVLCFNIWYNFGSFKQKSINSKSRELRRLLYFSLYGYGIPLILTIITIVMNKINPFDMISDDGCFSDISVLFIVFIPFILSFIPNIIFFILTLINIMKIKREISRMRKKDLQNMNKDKDTFCMYIKLFVSMGLSWTVELVLSFITSDFIDYIQWALELMLSILIFVTFVCKPTVYKLIRKRLGLEVEKTTSDSSTKSSLVRKDSSQVQSTSANCE